MTLFCILELAAELYNEVKRDSGLERLQVREVAEFHQNACVSTCSLVLAILYLEKMKSTNPDYIDKVSPSELLLVSLVFSIVQSHNIQVLRLLPYFSLFFIADRFEIFER